MKNVPFYLSCLLLTGALVVAVTDRVSPRELKASVDPAVIANLDTQTDIQSKELAALERIEKLLTPPPKETQQTHEVAKTAPIDPPKLPPPVEEPCVEPAKPIEVAAVPHKCKCEKCDRDPCLCEKEPAVESPKALMGVEPAEVPPASDQNIEKFVYPIRARESGRTRQGSCVSLGEGRFLTVSHLINTMYRPTVEIETSPGTWAVASFAANRGHDTAIAKTVDTSIPGIETRAPTYGERVEIYGLTTRVPQCGIVSNVPYGATSLSQISLEVPESGTEQGDSGGGVFGADGKLIGTLSAHNPQEHRAVYFEPCNAAPPPQASAKPAAAPQCVNGQCQQPAMKSPQATAPQMFYSKGKWYYSAPSYGGCANGRCGR